MIAVWVIVVLLGVAALYKGADLLISSASSMAAKLGVSTAVIGLSVVTLGSIVPELSIAVSSSFANANDLIIGNALGSSILKLGFVFGLAALIYPIAVQSSTLKHEFPWLIAASIIIFFLAFDLVISRGDALLLIAVGIAFQAYSVWMSQKEVLQESGKTRVEKRRKSELKTSRSWFRIALGIVLIIVGAKFFVDASLGIAQELNIPQILVGIIVIALGASIPELMVSALSSVRHMPALGIGNIIGSNVMNIHLVVGVAALIRPLTIHPNLLVFDFPIFIFSTLLVSVLFKSGHKLSRVEGAVLVAGYILYFAYSLKFWG